MGREAEGKDGEGKSGGRERRAKGRERGAEKQARGKQNFLGEEDWRILAVSFYFMTDFELRIAFWKQPLRVLRFRFWGRGWESGRQDFGGREGRD